MPNGVKQELRTVVLFLVLLFMGFSLFWVATHWIRNEPSTSLGDIVLVSLLVMPLLVYAIASGTLTELKGPGGWGASFSKVAAASISSTVTHDRISPDEELQILEKSDPEKLEALVRGLDDTKPIAMTVTLGKGSYSLEALRQYVEALLRFRSFKLVVFVDLNERFKACMSAWAAKTRLDTPGIGQAFVDVINQGSPELYSLGVVKKTISPSSTNAEALRNMLEYNLEALAVTDEYKQLTGIVEREQVVARMVSALAQ